MNLLLIDESALLDNGHARVQGRQHEHIVNTLKAKPGDVLNAGLIDGLMGEATILEMQDDSCTLSFSLSQEPPSALPLKLVLALPRPKMLRRVIQSVVAMGVKDIVLLNSWKVEKSYWQTPWLSEQALRENMLLGLEQAKDTALPRITQKKLFKPFVEDELANWSDGTERLLAHPTGSTACPSNLNSPCTLAIGPEGGFTEYEVEKMQEAGFQNVHIGPRILRVETAVPALISRLFPAF